MPYPPRRVHAPAPAVAAGFAASLAASLALGCAAPQDTDERLPYDGGVASVSAGEAATTDHGDHGTASGDDGPSDSSADRWEPSTDEAGDTHAPSGTGTDDGVAESDGGDDGPPPPPGLPCDQPFEYAGRQGCQSVVDGLTVKFFPLDEPAAPQRLVIFLHGDGGGGFTNNWGFDPQLLDWADPQGFLVMGIRSPTGYDGDPDPAFGAAQPEHAAMVATTLETFVQAYDVVQERALYYGFSGGAWFTTSSLIPVLGHRVPGIFVANCGGSGVSFGWEWSASESPDIVALNSLYLNYGDQDFLAPYSADSYAEYTALGFVTDQLVHRGATHCDHPLIGPTIDFWEREL